MAMPAEKLAESLVKLEKLQNERGIAIIKANDLTRTHKERLIENGFIREVIKGWVLLMKRKVKQHPGMFLFGISSLYTLIPVLAKIGVYLLNNRFHCIVAISWYHPNFLFVLPKPLITG
jgi:hypothetical protein